MATDTRKAQRDLIIDALAEFIAKDAARKSIELEMGKPHAKEWAKLAQAVGGFGYPTKQEIIDRLEAIL